MNASEALQELSEPWSRGDRVKTALDRVSKLTGISYWRCSDIWYGKARTLEASEKNAIADALQHKRALEARNELAELRDRISRMETRLDTVDQDFYRPQIDFMRKATGRSS